MRVEDIGAGVGMVFLELQFFLFQTFPIKYDTSLSMRFLQCLCGFLGN